jgi:hypothetical protein
MRHRTLTAVVLARTIAVALLLALSTAPFGGAFPEVRQTVEYFGVVLEIPEGYVGPVTTVNGIVMRQR